MAPILIDHQLTQFILSLPHPLLTNYFFLFLSAVGSFAIVWVVIAIVLMTFEEHKDRHFIVPFILAVLITAFMANIILKPLINRPRPFASQQITTSPTIQLADLLTFRQSDYPKDPSFPSGHASVSFAAATILAYFDKKRRWFFFAVAGLIAFSRIYLGFHYVGDVIAGVLLGWGISKIVILVSGLRAQFVDPGRAESKNQS